MKSNQDSGQTCQIGTDNTVDTSLSTEQFRSKLGLQRDLLGILRFFQQKVHESVEIET